MKRVLSNLRPVLFASFAAIVVAGCATPPPYPGGPTYYGYQAGRPQSVEMAVVESVRPVNVQGPTTGAGAVTGSVVGGLAGSQIGGSSSANAAGAIAGIILGGLIGNAAEYNVNRGTGIEITARLDSGRMIAVVQEPTEPFRPGDRVRVMSDGHTTRIAH
jgi:outer membrane lipoprotein SlyB